MIELKLIDSGEEFSHVHMDIELLYVLKGGLRVRVDDRTYNLRESDVIAVNANSQHGFRVPESSIICRITMKYSEFLESIQKQYALLWCNSAVSGSSAYRELTGILDEMIDAWLVSDKSRYIRQSITYRLIGCLAENFVVTESMDAQSGSTNARKDAILRYINANYFRALTLKEAADYCYMTQTAFSKYFKKTVGINFIEYLNQIRMHFAVQDLLFSDKAITHIAMDNGFSNPSAFNKYFRSVYNVTPKQFRDSMKADLGPTEQISGDDNELAKWYLREKQREAEGKGVEQRVDADARCGSSQGKIWTSAFNLGSAEMLLSESFRKQILEAGKRLPFQYGRIRKLFAGEMHFLKEEDPIRISFALQDDVLDFLTEHAIIPMIEVNLIGKMPDRNAALSVLQKWVMHLAERYGKAKVSQWIFEVSDVEEYADIAGIIRGQIPDCKVGIHFASSKEAKEFAEMRSASVRWPEMPPDFLSIDVLLSRQFDILGYDDFAVSDHRSLLYDEARSLEEAYGSMNIPIVISSWNLSTSENNAYNDSCHKAALMLENMVKAFDHVQLGIFSCLTDLANRYDDMTDGQFGGSGLINKDGVIKPAFLAMSFINSLLPFVIERKDGCIITSDSRERYVILLFNAKAVGQEYYLKRENEIRQDDMRRISMDEEPKTYHISLKNVKDGNYRCQRMALSSDRLWQDGWDQPEFDNLSLLEKEYLYHMSIPTMTVTHIQIRENTLVMSETLKANEICLYELNHIQDV